MIQAATPIQRDENAEGAERFEGRAKRQAVRIIRKIVAIALALAICMWAFIGWSSWSDYSAAHTVGQTEGFNLSAALARELTSALDSADRALGRIATVIQAIPPGEPNAAVRASLRQTVAAITGNGNVVRFAGPDGQLVFSSLDPDPGPRSYRDQAHFIAHRDNPSSSLTINPYVADSAGPFLEVSRRLNTAGGEFAGEVMLLLKPDLVLTLIREVDIGGLGMVVIVDADGTVRAGYGVGHLDGSIGVGTDLRGDSYPENVPPGGTAFYSRRGRLVKVERLVTMRSLQSYPLNVLVALDLDDVLGSARTHGWLVGLIGVCATGLIAVLSLLLGREVWRRTKREIELAYDRRRLHFAQVQIEADRTRLAETNRELLASKETAEAANRARSQFLAHMSHELRTPLHAIIGFSELIQDQAPAKPGAPPIAGYAADIWSSGRHLLELINTILDISKVESGTATLAETVFLAADLVRGSLVSVRAQAEARAITIDVDLPETILRIRADRTRMQQVLINLLSNAVKFSPDNGRIELAVAALPTGELVLSVTDAGIGMTGMEMEIALEPFGQVDSTLSRSFEGTGLGLPLARKLTELHGGRLELTSVKGRGTTAMVILPAERLLQRDVARTGGG